MTLQARTHSARSLAASQGHPQAQTDPTAGDSATWTGKGLGTPQSCCLPGVPTPLALQTNPGSVCTSAF